MKTKKNNKLLILSIIIYRTFGIYYLYYYFLKTGLYLNFFIIFCLSNIFSIHRIYYKNKQNNPKEILIFAVILNVLLSTFGIYLFFI